MKYSDETIFKMAAIRHFEFSKIAIFVPWRVPEHGFTCTYQIRVNHTITRGDIAKIRFSIWRLSAILNFINFINQHVTVPEPKFESAHQISSKSDDPRPRYSDKTIFKMTAVRHLEFSTFGILVTLPVSKRDPASSHKISR